MSPMSPLSEVSQNSNVEAEDEVDTPNSSGVQRAKSFMKLKETKTVTNLRKRFN